MFYCLRMRILIVISLATPKRAVIAPGTTRKRAYGSKYDCIKPTLLTKRLSAVEKCCSGKTHFNWMLNLLHTTYLNNQ